MTGIKIQDFAGYCNFFFLSLVGMRCEVTGGFGAQERHDVTLFNIAWLITD